MLIIIDSKSPEPSKKKLKKYGDLLEFSTSYITYDSISGHPDVFFCKMNDKLIIAPNTPEKVIEYLGLKGIDFAKGEKGVGRKYPDSAIYNAVVTEKNLIHNIQITDKSIIESSGNLKAISVIPSVICLHWKTKLL